MIDRIHHIAVAVRSADQALGFFRDIMGLQVAEDRVIESEQVRGVLLPVGENAIVLLEPTSADSEIAKYIDANGERLHHFAFATDDIIGELSRLKDQGVKLIDESPRESVGGQAAYLHPDAVHGVLVELVQPPAGAAASREKGFDHLSAAVGDYEAAKRNWKATVGLEVTGEVPLADRLVAQLPSGQVMVELLVPVGEDSPIVQRLKDEGEGASSMIAIETFDIDADIARYRSHGIELPNAAAGLLPNSVISTITPEQACGLRVQLIEFGRSS